MVQAQAEIVLPGKFPGQLNGIQPQDRCLLLNFLQQHLIVGQLKFNPAGTKVGQIAL